MVILVAIDELKAVVDPLIVVSSTSKVIVLSLTAVVIGPAPVNVKVSPVVTVSAVPVSASISKVEVIFAISLAILAEVAVKDPEIADLLPAEPRRCSQVARHRRSVF